MNAVEMLFLRAAVPAALASARATGVPASITIAQAILESGWGLHVPPGSNNCFGIKATDLADPATYVEASTTEYVNGQPERVEADFEVYSTLAACFTAHAQLLCTAPRYAPAMAVRGSPAGFARQLQACGYSTSPTYAATLMELVDEFDLSQYDPPAASA